MRRAVTMGARQMSDGNQPAPRVAWSIPGSGHRLKDAETLQGLDAAMAAEDLAAFPRMLTARVRAAAPAQCRV